MKPTPIVLSLLLLAIHPALPAAGSDPKPITVAVFDFEATGESDKAVGINAARLLAVSLGTSPDVLMVERAEIEKILGEQELALGGAVNPETAAKVGQLAGAQVLVTGRVFRAGDTNYLVAKIISAETGRTFAEKAGFVQLADLEKSVEGLAAKLAQLVAEKGNVLVATVETDEEFQRRLAKAIGKKKPGLISVQVAEQHIARPVIDPAVQTEIARHWIALGGKIAGPGESAPITVMGEAFSELGMRRGNLTACRARAEITVQKGDAVLSQDRAMASAVDLGEHIAGKIALEKAARLWLERHVADLCQD